MSKSKRIIIIIALILAVAAAAFGVFWADWIHRTEGSDLSGTETAAEESSKAEETAAADNS